MTKKNPERAEPEKIHSDDLSTSDGRRKKLGREGEDAAAKFYQNLGFIIIERNFRAGRFEIDLIVRNENLIVFVEVKTASGPTFGHPAERVDLRKQRRIVAVAQQYLIAKNLSAVDLRMDVVTFVGDKLEHYPNAFSTDEDQG